MEDLPLSGQRLDAIILGLERLDSDFEASFIERLMVPDIHGILRRAADYFPNNTIEGAILPLAHPRVPSSLALSATFRNLNTTLRKFNI